MTGNPQDEIAERVESIAASFGGSDKLSATQLGDIERVCQLETIAAECRRAILAGDGGVALPDLVRAEQIAADARATLCIPLKHTVNAIKVHFVGDYTAGLDHAEHERLDKLCQRIAEIDPDSEPATAIDALMLVERLRLEVKALRDQLAKAAERIASISQSAPSPATPTADNVVVLRPSVDRSESSPHPPTRGGMA
jgi:hypothetical protein